MQCPKLFFWRFWRKLRIKETEKSLKHAKLNVDSGERFMKEVRWLSIMFFAGTLMIIIILISIVRNIVSSLHKVFSLCARADWCDVWIEFTNLIIKIDVDVNEMPLSNIFKTRAIFEKKLTALHVVHSFYLFNRYVFILLTKLRTETKTVPSTWYIFNVQGCTHTDFHICALYCYWLTWGTGEFLKGKAKRFFRDWPFVYVTGGFISHQFGDYANINLWKSDNM